MELLQPLGSHTGASWAVLGLNEAKDIVSKRATVRALAQPFFVPAKEQLNTECAELSDYFPNGYLDGDLYDGSCYSESWVGELCTYKYEAPDGDVMVWRHAFDLRAFGEQGEEVDVLYHYTDELPFRNVGDLEQMAAQLFASLKEDRAHFGQGVYATKHEPAVWGSRLRILLNNYSRGDPLCPDPSEAGRVEKEWGSGRGKSGHRAAFCIPLIVPRSIAYNIFERQTPDMAKRTVKDSAGQERPIKPGEDYKGRPVHCNRDVWVTRVETDGEVQHAAADADSILDLLQLRVRKLLDSVGEDLATAACMYELARRLDGRGRYPEAFKCYRECLRIRTEKLGEDHPHTLNCLNNMAFVVKALGGPAKAEPLYSLALKKSAKLGDDHTDTYLICLNNMALCLQDQGRLTEAAKLHREALEKSRKKLGEDHPDTSLSIHNMALCLHEQGRLTKAAKLYREFLKKSEAILGKEHPQVLLCLNNLAGCLKRQGRLTKAAKLYREALKKSKEKLGKDHPDTLLCLHNLAYFLHGQQKLAEAEPLYREALQKRRLKLGNQHPDTMISIYNFAFLLKSMEKFKEAEEFFREHLAACMAVHGEDHKETVGSRRNLAKFLEERGKVDESQELRRLAGQTTQ